MIKLSTTIMVLLCAFGLFAQDDHMTKMQAESYIKNKMHYLVNPQKHEGVAARELNDLIKLTQVYLLKRYAHYPYWYSFSAFYLESELFEGAVSFVLNYIEEKIVLYAHEEVGTLTPDHSLYKSLAASAIKNVRNELLAEMVKKEHKDYQKLFSQFLGMELRTKIIDALIEEIKRISPNDGKPIVYQPLECPVCMDQFDESVIRVVLLPCHHYICKNCLSQWQEKLAKQGAQLTCPTCRGEVYRAANTIDSKNSCVIL